MRRSVSVSRTWSTRRSPLSRRKYSWMPNSAKAAVRGEAISMILGNARLNISTDQYWKSAPPAAADAGAQRPQRASKAIVGSLLLDPTAIERHEVAETAVAPRQRRRSRTRHRSWPPAARGAIRCPAPQAARSGSAPGHCRRCSIRARNSESYSWRAEKSRWSRSCSTDGPTAARAGRACAPRAWAPT